MEKALKEISEAIKKFLLEHGGREDGRDTKIFGTIYSDNKFKDIISNITWETPASYLSLDYLNYTKYSNVLILSIKSIILKYNIIQCIIFSKQKEGYQVGWYDVYIKIYRKDTIKIS